MAKRTKKAETIQSTVMNEYTDDQKDKHDKENDQNLYKSPEYDGKKDTK